MRAAPRDLRLAVDTGGTFTDLVVAGDPDGLRFFKRPTTPHDPVEGLLDVIASAAEDFDLTSHAFLARGDVFVYGTTHATNAVVTGTTARTALLTTKGHPDVLLFREGGGRTSLFDYTQEYPDPYIPRSLTFEVPERTRADGTVHTPLDEEAVVEIVQTLERTEIQAVAVCLLWSIVNPSHELLVGELLDQHLPGVPYTLSHRLNPSLREYRRASSAAIDASLKPLMGRFFANLAKRLSNAGFDGRLLVLTSAGGVLDAGAVGESPIHAIGSGPAAAPVAGRHFAQLEAGTDTALVTDAGGTTYDVSLVRRSQIPWTRETVVGHPTYGYMTGFPSVDVRSIGAGGGSIAWVDHGGLLHVGPQSAGAAPGPACYARGGKRATVTDACVVLGYIDPDYFLGGEMRLDSTLAREAVLHDIGEPLGLGPHEAAFAVLNLAIERMVGSIETITLNQGIDPREAVMIGGGGGAGLYAVGIARRLGCDRVIIPEVSAALSATGALLSDLEAEFALTGLTTTDRFDFELARDRLDRLRAEAESFLAGPGEHAVSSQILYSVEVRYPHQVWEIEVPLRRAALANSEQVEELRRDFHGAHEELFAVFDPDSPVEVVTWRARARCSLGDVNVAKMKNASVPQSAAGGTRAAYFLQTGVIDTPACRFETLGAGEPRGGPLIVESATTTIVIDPDASLERTARGSLIVYPGSEP